MASGRPSLVDQVRDGIVELISNGTYSFGDQLPNEQEMCERFEVSRATVREAYRALIDAGYLSRRHGTGTFVARIPHRHALDLNLSYTEMIRDAGFTPSIQIVGQQTRPADGDEQDRLRLDPGANVIEVERVRYADDRPVVFSIDRVPEALVPEGLREKLSPSLFAMLEETGHPAHNARTRILPVLAGERESRQLGVPAGAPLLYFDEIDYDDTGSPVLASFEWHTSDVFELWLNRRQPM